MTPPHLSYFVLHWLRSLQELFLYIRLWVSFSSRRNGNCSRIDLCHIYVFDSPVFTYHFSHRCCTYINDSLSIISWVQSNFIFRVYGCGYGRTFHILQISHEIFKNGNTRLNMLGVCTTVIFVMNAMCFRTKLDYPFHLLSMVWKSPL